MAIRNPKNAAVAIGRLGWDVRLEKVGEWDKVILMVAADRNVKDKKTGEYQTDWILISAIGEDAKRAANLLKKGDLVDVEYTIKSRQVENDGKKRTVYDFNMTEFQKLYTGKPQATPEKEEVTPTVEESVEDVPF